MLQFQIKPPSGAPLCRRMMNQILRPVGRVEGGREARNIAKSAQIVLILNPTKSLSP